MRAIPGDQHKIQLSVVDVSGRVVLQMPLKTSIRHMLTRPVGTAETMQAQCAIKARTL